MNRFILLMSSCITTVAAIAQTPLNTSNGVKTLSSQYTGDLNTNQNWGGTGATGMYIFNAQTFTNSPASTEWTHIIEMQHDNGNNWTGQIALGYFTDGMYYRQQHDGNVWGNWHTVATRDWLQSNYLPLSGGGVTGSLGVGTNAPQSVFHIFGGGISKDAIAAYNGAAIIQASTGGRSATSGAQLEFVIPANADGSNPWGQGRIITVAGNSASGNATGMMILGTRRMFNKTGIPNTWNYGDDIVIDGNGNVGIGTLTHREALSVNGNIRAKDIKVEATNWPDYVFQPEHQLPSLESLAIQIKQQGHLPNIPSADDVSQNGIALGDMNKKLLEKVEELTLYAIKQNEEVYLLKKQNELLLKRIEKLENKK